MNIVLTSLKFFAMAGLVIIVVSLLKKESDRLEHEREMRRKLLIQPHLGVCLEFYYPESDIANIKLSIMIKKRTPNVVLFHKCCPKTVEEYHERIFRKQEMAKFFHRGTTGELRNEIGKKLFHLENTRDLPRFLTAGLQVQTN